MKQTIWMNIRKGAVRSSVSQERQLAEENLSLTRNRRKTENMQQLKMRKENNREIYNDIELKINKRKERETDVLKSIFPSE